MDKRYLPVKFLEKKYADEMLKGRIMMRPLADFGAWELQKQVLDDEGLGSGERRDVMEGTVYNLSKDEKDPFFDALDDEFKSSILGRYYIDDALKDTRLFCMYRMNIREDNKNYEPVNPKLREFGDTAVIILDPEKFYQRICAWSQMCFPQQYVVGVGDVNYKSVMEDYGSWGLFVKDKKYEWQKEVRIVAHLNPMWQRIDDKSEEEAWFTELGDLSDIAVEVSTDELIEGTFQLNPDSKTQQLLEATERIPEGVLREEYIVFGDYSHIKPEQKWIALYQQILKPDEWIAITQMRKLHPALKQYPVLSFQNIDKVQQVNFLPDRLGIILKPENETILQKLLHMQTDDKFCTYHISRIRTVNMGEVAEAHLKFEERTAFFRREIREDGLFYHEICRLGIIDYKSRNVFGLDIADRGWLFTDELSVMMNAGLDMNEVMNIFGKMKDILEKREKELCGKEDIYERFQDL